MRPAGTLLLAIARLLFDESVVSRTLHPTIADLQEELREAGTDRRRRLLARWRGYWAFWVLVLASPIAFWSWPMTSHTDDRHALLSVTRLIAAALVLVALLTTGAAMVRFDYVFEGLPTVVSGMLADAQMLAFMAGPAALVLLFVFRGLRRPVRFRVRPAEATLVTLLSATVTVTTGPIVFVNAFTGIATTGGGSLSIVAEAGVLSLETLVYVAVAVTACLLVVTPLAIRGSRGGSNAPADPARMPPRLAVALAVMMCSTLVAVHLLLRSYYGFLDQILSLVAPPPSVGHIDVGGIAGTAERLANSAGLLFLGGVVLTVFLTVAGATTWRVSRTRTPHAVLTWASRAALIVVIVGAWWHGSRARAALDTYRDLPQLQLPGPSIDRSI